MNREIAKDFDSLVSFITNYNLTNIVNADALKIIMKPMHKKLFSFMTFIAEIEVNNNNKLLLNNDGLNYLKKSCSDIGQALFCWLQGAYKPANLLLRSSIETFVRALASQDNGEILIEKSMYRVFELARGTSLFNSEYCIKYFDIIHGIYKNLCKVVHTSNIMNMAHISALKTFPLLKIKEAENFSKVFISTSTMMLSIIYYNYYKYIYTMHPENQQNYLCSIPWATKRKINDRFEK